MMITAIPLGLAYMLTYGEVRTFVFLSRNVSRNVLTKSLLVRDCSRCSIFTVGSNDDICSVSGFLLEPESFHVTFSPAFLVYLISCRYMGPAEVATWGMVGFLWDTFEEATCECYLAECLCRVKFGQLTVCPRQ
jgi:hypothetical protein